MASAVRTIEERGATVKDLAGDGVPALFGAPVAHEDAAERAVGSGLRIAHHGHTRFHQADRMAVADRVAVIPLFYAQSLALIKPRITGWRGLQGGGSLGSLAPLLPTSW